MKTLPRAAALLTIPFFAQAEPPAAPALQALVHVLGQSSAQNAQLNILRGINAAMKGQRHLVPPGEWKAVYGTLHSSPNAEVRQQALALGVTFGDPAALGELRTVLADRAAPLERRRTALDALAGAKDAPSLPLLLAEFADATPLRAAALHALSTFDDPSIPAALLLAYPQLASDQKRDALAALTSRPAWARELLHALEAKTVARTDITAPLARQLQDLHHPEVDEWLAKNWGSVRTSNAEKQKEMARFKAFLTPAFMQKGDPCRGRAIFAQTCAICHTIFGTGAKIGPELPGAFQDIDYLLQNILDPNAIIGKDYQQTVVQTTTGQTVIGIVGGEDGGTLTLKSLGGPIVIQRAEIASLTVLDVSLMPEGLLAARDPEEVRDLFAYLGRHGQVPMLATEENATDFFNGADLTHWIPSNPAAWKVEKSALIGQGSGDRTESLRSDMVFKTGRFTCQISAPAAATVRLLVSDAGGKHESQFDLPTNGDSDPCQVEVTAEGRVRITQGGASNLPPSLKAPSHQWRSPLVNGGTLANGAVIGFAVTGDAPLRITDLRLQWPPTAPPAP